jgi:hypothetical protein
MPESFFILSKDYLELAIDEVVTIVKMYDRFAKIKIISNLVIIQSKTNVNEISDPGFLGNDIYPEGLHILRHIDCGTWIYREDGFKEKIL